MTQSVADLMKAWDAVWVDAVDGFGGKAHVVDTRDHPYTRCKVVMEDGSQPPFWAHDCELTPRQVEEDQPYDSRADTLAHIGEVRTRLEVVIKNLNRRQAEHDLSKLAEPEKSVFDEFTPKLKNTTYGSEEYKGFLAKMKCALDHHYANNSHHPEHYLGTVCAQCGNREDEPCTCGGSRTSRAGVKGMCLLDLIEMLCDWKAATLRHADGDLGRSIQINQKRFGYSDELKQILVNTAMRLGFL